MSWLCFQHISNMFFSELLCNPPPKNKKKQKNLKFHFSVNIELVAQAPEDLRCFHKIWYLKWEKFSFALASVSRPIGI